MKSITTSSRMSRGILMIEKPIREPVTENNPNVVALVEADYSVKQSIDAVVRCETLEAALTYLEEKENSDEEFVPTPHNSIFIGKW